MHRFLHITRGSSGGYDDQAEGMESVQEPEAPAESGTQNRLMYRMGWYDEDFKQEYK